MNLSRRKTLSLLLALAVRVGHAQELSFPDRKALILNNCPHVALNNFYFSNRDIDGRVRFAQNLAWKNVGAQPIVAIELVVLKYDAFDRRMLGTRWVVTGRTTTDWRPLDLGQSGSDRIDGLLPEDVFTAIVYVRAARLADGTVWRASEPEALSSLRRLAPRIVDFGSLGPDSIDRQK